MAAPEVLEAFWAPLEQAIAAFAAYGDAEMIRECQCLAKEVLGRDGKCIILAIDEAGTLCGGGEEGNEKFQSPLTALTIFEGEVFGVFLDTSSKVRGFVTSKSRGLVRGPQGRFSQLLRPYYTLPPYGIFDIPAELAAMRIEAPSHKGH